MMILISDLHLGEGAELEDFAWWSGRLPRRKTAAALAPALDAMHERWNRFVDFLITQAARETESSKLILLGDVLDLLQVQDALCDPAKIDRIVRAHRPWFDALERASRAGIRISYIVGNHDHELLHPDVWRALYEAAPYLNEPDGAPLVAWRDDALGIHAEHGSQFDPANRLDDFLDPTAMSLGGHIVLGLINAFEPHCPWLDLMPNAPTALWYALTRIPGLLARPLRAFLFQPGDGDHPEGNLDFLPEVENLLRRVWLKSLPRKQQTLLRSVLSKIAAALEEESITPPMARVESRFFSSLPGARKIRPHLLLSPSVETNPSTESNSIGADPEPPLKVLATGHTHLPEIAMGRDGVHLVNCGSWKARARPRGSRRLILEQTLDAIVIRPLPEGRLDISLLQIDPSGREWTQPNQ